MSSRLTNKILSIIFVVTFLSIASSTANASQKVSLYELAQKIAQQSNLTFIFSPRIKKARKVDIRLGKNTSQNSLYELFTSILSVYGYAAVEQDDVVLVVRERRARQLWSR